MVKKIFREVYAQGHETNLRFLGLQETPGKNFWDLPGVPGHAPPENFENGTSQID